jgi:hypothetical protein
LLTYIIIFIYLEIEFIKALDDVKIKQKTITFTKDEEPHTVFANKMINSAIEDIYFFIIFIFIYSILLANCCAFAQMIVVFLV